MSDTVRSDGAASYRDDHAASSEAPSSYASHLVRCGSCGRWLHVDEDELLASLETTLTCWACSQGP